MSFPQHPKVKDFSELGTHADAKNKITLMGATVVGVATYDRVDRYTLQDGNSNQVVALVFANRNGVRAKMAYGVCVCWAAFDVFPGSTLDLSKCRVDRDQYTDMPRVFVEKYTMVNGWLVGQPTFVNFGCLCTQIALKSTIAVEDMVLGHVKAMQAPNGHLVSVVGFVLVDSLADVVYQDYNGDSIEGTEAVMVDSRKESADVFFTREHSFKIKVGSGNDGGCVVSLLGAKVKELGENKKVRWGQHVVLMFGCSCMPI